MASDQSPPAAAAAPSNELSVNLKILSPSVGVSRPLTFSDLSATTTIKELKAKIRESLPMRPSDHLQRLICRGKAVTYDTDTLLKTLGEDNIRSGEQQTIHLVIRDNPAQSSTPTATSSSSTPGNAQPGRQPGAQRQPTAHPRAHILHHHHQPQGLFNMSVPPPNQTLGALGAHGATATQPAGSQASQGFPRRNPTQPTFTQTHVRPASIPSPSPLHNAEQAAAFQHHHQTMANWLRNAAQGQHGTFRNPALEPNNGRGSPLSHFYRETIGPNGQAYQVETVIRGSSLVPNPPTGPLSIPEAQNILRHADMLQAALAANNQLPRGTSEPPPTDRRAAAQPTPSDAAHEDALPPGQFPDTTLPQLPGFGPWTQAPMRQPGADYSSLAQPDASRQPLEVYILSSPEGPRGLLVHSNPAETYYTPNDSSSSQLRYRLRTRRGPDPSRYVGQNTLYRLPDTRQHATNAAGQQVPLPGREPQNPVQDQLPDGMPGLPGDGVANPHGPQGPVLPPLLVQAWPHIWLLFRLGVFVWFFTTPASSWSRWFSVVGCALFIFVLSSGLLNGFADMAWRPLAQQLERLLPRMEPPPGQIQDAGADGNQEPDPADMATRLLAQQRERQGWFQGQIRRVERAALLFIASIAPGVAEGHIANLEAEARAERQRREAEELENARRQREAAGNTDETNGNGGDGAPATEPSSTAQQPPAGEAAQDQAPQPEPVAG